MEWHSSLIDNSPSFAPPSARADQTSFNFVFNSNLHPTSFPPPPGMDLKQAEMMQMMMGGVGVGGGGGGYGEVIMSEEKKKRMTCEQLESLEKSFQEEIKLDPERKMRLSRELSLQPRQVAVWFQNRRARWKAKQLERLYDSLRLQFDAVSREKHSLQQEVMKLRAMLMEQAGATRNNMNPKQVSVGFTDASGRDETAESTSAAAMNGGSAGGSGGGGVVAAQLQPQHSDCPNYAMLGALEDYNTSTTPPYWAAHDLHPAAYPPC